MQNRIIYSWYVSFDIWSQSNPVHNTITLYDQYYENNIWITHDNIIQNDDEDLEITFNEAPEKTTYVGTIKHENEIGGVFLKTKLT